MVVWMRIVPPACLFEYMAPSSWNHLRRLRKGGLVGGGVSLGVGSEVSKASYCSAIALSTCACGLGSELLASAPSLCPPAYCYVPVMVAMGFLTCWNWKPPTNYSFYKLPWSWCLIEASVNNTRCWSLTSTYAYTHVHVHDHTHTHTHYPPLTQNIEKRKSSHWQRH